MARIWDNIQSFFNRRDNHTLYYILNGYGMPLELSTHKFGETIFLNIAQMETDLYSEVIWSSATPTPKYKAWVDFVNRNGQRIMLQLLRDKGYAVIGYESERMNDTTSWAFYELPEDKYMIDRKDNRVYIECKDAAQMFYVLKSPTLEQTGESDHWWCKPYIAMLDAVFNGATTTAERLGAYVVMSPKQNEFGGIIDEKDKDDLEKNLQHDYGMLKRQKQIMVIPRAMDSQVVNLAGVDLKMNDKARAAILAIADRLKVPANQIAFIDSNSSKSLSNGSELREGDMAKYRTFRRLLNATFFDMATELGMKVDYTIENEPKSVQGQKIEQ